MQTDTVGISSVIPYARNPRRNEAAIAKVAASLQEFGWRQPIVVDEDMVVVAGHTRLEAARTLNMEQVPVHIARGLTPEQIKAYRIADNRVGQEAEWDEELLRLELGELEGMDFNMESTGFNAGELRDIGGLGIEILDEFPDLPDGEKTPYQQKTFTFHDEQAAIVDNAIMLARKNPLSDSDLNENANANAVAFICGQWLTSQHE
jgi:ParB-like chromosome segregation protein Spo0J